jgi:O-antigen/teichoic acid export membrane protein
MSVKRDTLYNLAGSVLPMIVSLITVPIYLHLIGNPRYGVLALVWLILGYFGVFDPGITRAALYHLARLSAPEQAREREGVFWTALTVNLAFGVAGGIVLYVIARPVFMYAFKMPVAIRAEVMRSLPWLAVSVTVSVVTGVFGGALQAREKFGYLNSVTVVTIILTQVAPLAVAYWHGPDLAWLIPTVLVARMMGAIPNFLKIARVLPLGTGGKFDRAYVKTLFSYGGWVTVTNLIGPILEMVDRLLIGSVLNAEAVAFYTVPFNLAARASVIPAAVANSLFPKWSRASSEASKQLASEAVATLSAIMTPLIVVGIVALPLFMQHWVGPNFAAHAAPVGIIILIGIWANGLAFIPFGHLQATGRPDLPAIFHASELLPFLGLLWFALHSYGLVGAAWAWTLRVVVDAILLFAVAGQIPGWRRVLPGGMFVLIAAAVAPGVFFSIKTVVALTVITASIAWSWSTSSVVRSVVWRFVLNPALELVR